MLRRSLFTVLLLPLLAMAAPPDPWVRMQTANFELFTDAGEHTGREILKQFERVHSFFETAFSNKRANAKPVCLIAFHSPREYQLYRPNEVAAAFFQPGNDRDFIVMTAGVTETSRVPVHEYTHLMIHQSGQRIPLWMNEGTAELFSTMQARGPKVLVGDIIPSHLATLAREKWIDLDILLSADHSSPLYNEKSDAGIFYSESWLLVHMLNLDSEYRPHLRDFTAALQENDAPTAFLQAYSKSLADVQDDLYQYFQRKRVNGLLFPVQLPKSADDPEIQPGATFGIRLALAVLMSDTLQHHNQARAAFFGLSRDYPDKWEVEAGLAQFYLRERDGVEAAKHYAKAVEMGCKDVRTYVDYGRTLGSIRREKEAAAVLRSAVQLDSTNQQAHYELAIALTGAGEYPAALNEFKGLQHLSPQEAPRYYYFLAYALYREGQFAQARAILERGKPFATSEQDKNNYAGLAVALESRMPLQAGNPPDRKPGEPAQLVHRNVATETDNSLKPSKNSLPTVEGQLTKFDCNGKQAVLHLTVSGAEELFVIEDPQKVTIRGAGGAAKPMEFHCGPQKNELLLVQYEDAKDESGKIIRVARILEFR